jgi:hypothetical protein
MGVWLMFGTAGATGGGFSAQPGSLQPSYEESWHEPKWQWQNRGPETWKDKNQFRSLWSFGCRIGCAEPTMDGAAPIGRCMQAADPFEPFGMDGDGTQSMNFLRGTCVDSGGTPVANAIVQAFVTATDAIAGEVQAKLDGTYAVPVQQSKVTQHYLVAYKTGSPDTTGATVNTLLPTNVDGT